jgi:hypothetical protein
MYIRQWLLGGGDKRSDFFSLLYTVVLVVVIGLTWQAITMG